MYHFSYAHTYVSLIFQTNEIQPEIFTSPMSQSFTGNGNGRIGSNGLGSSFGHSQPIRVDSTTSINSDEDGPHNAVSRELRTAAGT